MSDAVSVVIGGRRFAGWKSVHIEAGIEQVARAFAMEVTETFPGSVNLDTFHSGDLVQVYIGADLVCTGYITSTPVNYDGKSVKVQIQGKSKTVDLVDCCPTSATVAAQSGTSWQGVKGKSGSAVAAPKQPATSWKNQPTSVIMAALAAPYGVTVRDDVGIGEKLANHTVNPGETVMASINRLITKDNLVVTDDAEGNLVIADPGGAGLCSDALVLGKNVLSAAAAFDASKVFSDYVVLGQHKGTDEDFGATAAQDKGVAKNPAVGRFRLKVLKDSGQSANLTCRERAVFERNYDQARFGAVTYTVQGWRQSVGVLWPLNALVVVKDDVLGIKRKTYLIAKLTFDLSAGGMTTKIECCAPDGYRRKDGQTSKSKSAGNSWQGVK